MTLGNRLRNLRENKGLKQNYVAEKMGIQNNTLSNYESDNRTPHIDTIIKFADFYEVSIDYLLKGTIYEKGNLHFFDVEGLSNEEIEDIKKHIDYIKWKTKGDNN